MIAAGPPPGGGAVAVNRALDSARATLLAVGCGACGAGTIILGTAVASPFLGLIAVAGLIVIGVIGFYPAVGLLLSAFVVPIERFGRLTDDPSVPIGSLMRIVGSVALVSVLLHIAVRRWRLVLPLPFLLYAAYVGLGALSLLWAVHPPSTQAQAATALGNLMFLFLVANGARDWGMVRLMTVTWLFATVLIGLHQVYDWHFGRAEDAFESEGVISNRFSTTWDSSSEIDAVGVVRRALGPTSNAAVYGINLILTVPFFLYFMKVAPAAWVRRLTAGGLILVLYNMLLTNTRAVMIFGALTLAWCAFARLLRVTAGRLILAAGLGAAFLAAAPDNVWTRVLDVGNYTVGKSSNLRMRFEVWDAAVRIGSDYWLTGIGVGDRTMLPKYTEIHADLMSPHNEFLNVFMELGGFGLTLFLLFLVASIVLIRRSAAIYRADPAGADRYWFLVAAQISVAIGILFGIQVDVFHFSLKGWWLILGLACVLHQQAVRPAPAREAATPSAAPPRFVRFARSVRP